MRRTRGVIAMRYVVALLCLAISAATAHTQDRQAFVVGIDTYDKLATDAQLRRARADARAIATTFSELGYAVTLSEDVTRSGFNEAWQDFIAKLQLGDSVVFYFAGHGIELNAQNYLVPRDVPAIRPGRDEQLKRESISLQEIMADLVEKKVGLRLFIIDACRESRSPGSPADHRVRSEALPCRSLPQKVRS